MRKSINLNLNGNFYVIFPQIKTKIHIRDAEYEIFFHGCIKVQNNVFICEIKILSFAIG